MSIKQYEESLQPLQQAISLTFIVIPLPAPFDEPHYYLGLSQLMLGHKSEAMEQYQELKKMKSDFADKLLSEINKQ